MRRYADAQALFRSLLEIARATDDSPTEARCHHNLAWCAIFLDDYKTANIQFSEAITILTDLGQTLAATRAQLGAGKVLIGKGQTESGLRYLYDARNAFEQHGMSEEANLCALFTAETLLTRGDGEEAREIVREVAQQLRTSAVERRIVDAVSALEQQIVSGDEPVTAVRHVYALLESVQRELSA
jgi:tetratricopeptide (TPR) repeat protein